MQIPILIERIEGGYRARAGEPFALSAEGRTKREAYQQLQGLIFDRLTDGADLVALEVPLAHPYAMLSGTPRTDDPFLKELREAIEENRRREDAENP